MPEALLTFALYGEFITIGRVFFALHYWMICYSHSNTYFVSKTNDLLSYLRVSRSLAPSLITFVFQYQFSFSRRLKQILRTVLVPK